MAELAYSHATRIDNVNVRRLLFSSLLSISNLLVVVVHCVRVGLRG